MTGTKQQKRARDAFAAALAHHNAGDLAGALAGYELALRHDPRLPDALNNRGIVLTQLDRAEDALASFAKVIAFSTGNPARLADAHANRGIALGNLGRFAEALAAFDAALALIPAHAAATHYRPAAAAALAAEQAAGPGPGDDHVATGLAAAAAQDHAAALAAFDRAVSADAGSPVAHANRGLALLDLGRAAEALAALDCALALDPALGVAHYARGRALRALLRDDEALAAFNAALAAGETDPALHHARADALAALGRLVEALAAYRMVAVTRPHLPAGPYGCALMHWRLGDAAAALAAADEALARDPAYARASNLRGLALQSLGRIEEALAACEQAVRHDPANAHAHSNRAELLRELGRIEEAAAAMAQALAANTALDPALGPALGHTAGQLLHMRMRLSDWADHDAALAAVIAGLKAGTAAPLPFALLALVDDPALHALAAARQIDTQWPVRVPTRASEPPASPPAGKIRIGYFSADFFHHATMFLLAEVLEAHDRARFEITAFSYGPNTGDPWRRRAEAAADRFIDIQTRSDHDVAALARSLGIDIAVDLKGLTGGGRTGIFAARAAPLQVNWLGYPGSMPAPFIDYLIADPHLIPPTERPHYAERIVTLPHSYQPNCRIASPGAPAPDLPIPGRAELGLPERGFVFCCFNQNYKVTPSLFTIWMRILGAVPDSVLWLWAEHETARANLRREAAARAIDPARLVFAAFAPRDRHLARLPHADLFLDTRPYGAHTSGSDALRAGVPLVTCPGRSFASRVGAGLLHAAGLPELVCADMAQYEARAIALAAAPAELAALRARLEDRGATPLFDPAAFARHLEAAYTAIHHRALRGEPPEDIIIPG